MDWHEQLEADGYSLLTNVFSVVEADAARRACEAALADPAAAASLLVRDGGRPHGARNLLRLWPGAIALARHPRLREALIHALGLHAGVVRGLYFDKPPCDSWALPWHRDTTIAVKAPGPLATFRKPRLKARVPHVEASADLLEAMLTARIHLDDVSDRNGPLRVIPGSHRPGSDRESVAIHCRAGDVLMMRPRLLHASGHCDPQYRGHRRIVHLETAGRPSLPDGYEWHDYLRLAT